MSWRDDVTAQWQQQGQDWPLNFILGWVQTEETNNAARPTKAPLLEVGWFQISAEEARTINVDHDQIPLDQAYSFQSGMALLRHYSNKVNAGQFGGTAYYGMTKLWHTLPVLAQFVKSNLSSASDWPSVSEWIRSSVSSADIRGYDPIRMVRVVDKVMSYQGGFSSSDGQPSTDPEIWADVAQEYGLVPGEVMIIAGLAVAVFAATTLVLRSPFRLGPRYAAA